MQKSLVITSAALAFILLGAIGVFLMQKGMIMAPSSRSLIHAPEFPSGLQWLNTETPLTIAGLRGKVVLLDFWTYCCINCMHVLPDLKALERKYPNELVVIGVHSAKFTNERDTDHIRQAILRYDIEHPVVNDHEFRIWQSYAVRAWPTLALIDPSGYVVGSVSGEGHFDRLDQLIGEILQAARARGAIDATSRRWQLEKEKTLPSALAFPGKVLADGVSDRLFIADSNHHRIVIADLQGNVLGVAGTGQAGQDDGAFAHATFHQPQGLALDGAYLYVADTGNHRVRRLDLTRRHVETILGTGQQARKFNITGTGHQVPINSPWDVAIVGRLLYVAMAGFHQIWMLNLDTLEAQVFAGSGHENIVDGPRLQGGMAQPSGLATDGQTLYVADSETSSIRAIDLGNGTLTTIVGEGLFDYGDQDGTGTQVRLQHPLGIAWSQHRLYVADTYNHKIKVIDPQRKTSHTYIGSGRAGYRDGQPAEFYEPGGLSRAADTLYIADTNNHAIRTADLRTGDVTTLALTGLAIPGAVAGFDTMAWLDGDRLTLPPHTIKAGGDGQLVITFELPKGYKLNPAAPVSYTVDVSGDGMQVSNSGRPLTAHAAEVLLQIPFRTASGTHRATLEVDATFYWCHDDDTGVCMIQSTRWHVPVDISESGADRHLVLSTAARLADVPGSPVSRGGLSEYRKGEGR